jgi:hypothetical protein
VRERDEALERLAASSQLLQVISGSTGDLKPLFESILVNATRICDASFANLVLFEGDDHPTGHPCARLDWRNPGNFAACRSIAS